STMFPLQAMTVHKSQGSQFDDVTVVLPPPDSALLTRELFYTAITRARQHLTVMGTRESIRRAIGQPTQRNSGLKRQWRRMRQGGISSSDT
ncbi:MAG: ATP-binding domain-containing protein, partial [Cutibacterium granulosum]|nr:ATP-binding domain-containing protein [Cutibacterium granulosum]